MTEYVDPTEIEGIVGAKRHPTFHLARAISSEEKVYILHSEECRNTSHRLKCEYTKALEREGIDRYLWEHHLDRPVLLSLSIYNELMPWDYKEGD